MSLRRSVPTDLAVVGALAVTAVLALLLSGVPRFLEVALGVPFLLVVPGYAVVAVAFPGSPDETAAGRGGPGWTARAALSLAASAIVVAVVGVALGGTAALRLVTVVPAIAAVAVLLLAVAAVRRYRRPSEDRADPVGAGALAPVAGLFGDRPLQTVAMTVALVALLASVAYAGGAPQQGAPFTEVYLLAENESGGPPVAEGYPTTFVAGEGHPLYVGIENHEHRTVSYGVVAVAETVGPDGTVTDRRELDRFGVRVPPGERAVVERDIAPRRTAESVRLRFLVYEGPAPEDPAAERADQAVNLWVAVVQEGGG
jgi:uncharacterized membrane protein